MADVRFEFEINGKRLCISGLEGFGVLSASLSYVKHDPALYDEEKNAAPAEWSTTRDEWETGSIGIVSTGLKDKRHSCWFNEELSVGDEIKIRILGPGESDPPKRSI